jgi:hypothetical protein
VVVCVPLVLAGPGIAPGRSSGAVSLRDLYPTLLAAAGLLDPESLAPEGEQGWRDLRTASPSGRIVAVERRRIGLRARPVVRSHAAAAFDGTKGVIVGEESAPPSDASDRRTVALYREAMRRVRARAPDAGAPQLDPALADALRSLGYAE